MSILRKLMRNAGPLADRAVGAVADNAEKVDGGIDKVAARVDQRTGGKHSDKITKATGKAKGMVTKAEERSGRKGGPPTPGSDGTPHRP